MTAGCAKPSQPRVSLQRSSVCKLAVRERHYEPETTACTCGCTLKLIIMSYGPRKLVKLHVGKAPLRRRHRVHRALVGVERRVETLLLRYALQGRHSAPSTYMLGRAARLPTQPRCDIAMPSGWP